MNNYLKEIDNKNERELQPNSTLFCGERLCLSTLNLLSNEEYLLSGHGHFLEFYSQNSTSTIPVLSFDIFPDSKSNVQGVLPFLNNKVLFCFGEKECAILFFDNFSKHKGNSKIIPKYKFGFNHWITAAKILSHNKVILHFSTNCLKLFNFGGLSYSQTNEFFNLSKFEEKSIQLESRTIITSSILDGENWESLQIFAGTSLGAIHLFNPAKNGTKIVRTFRGNNGMPFAIRSHPNFLFSVGDDRSLRVWSKNTGKQICEKFSHGARIFALEILSEQKLIFTAGMDEYICIWQWTELKYELIEVNLLKNINICGGSFGTIRAIRPCFNQSDGNINLILASERGGLANISSFLNFNDPKQPILPRIKVNTFVFVNPIWQQNKLLYLIDEFRHLQIFKLSNELCEFTLLSELSSKINAQLLFRDEGQQQFRPDLFTYSTKLDALAICTKKTLFILKVFPIGNSNQEFDFNFAILEGEFLQLIWIHPNDCYFLLTVNTNGEAVIFDFSQSFGGKVLHFHQFAQFQFSKNLTNFPHIQCTLLIHHRKNENEEENGMQTICLLFLGTRSGTILAYSFGKGTPNCICIYREAHGNSTVTALHSDPSNTKFIDDQFIGEFHSLGRDGTLRKWKWRFNIEQNELDLSLCSLHRLNFEWPCSFLQDGNRRLIAGFQSDDFVLFDVKTNSILSQMKCGGGNRHWQLFIPYNDYNKYGLAFTQNSMLHFMPIDPIQIDLIKAPSHSENIVALSALFTQNGWIILTGSLDRRISSFLLNHENEDQPKLIKKSSIQMHRSSIETICLSKENNLILTGGGRSELFCWNMDEKLNLNFVFSYKLESANNNDIRLISICSLNSKFTIVLCSDGTIRLIHFSANSTISECARFLIPSLAMFSAIQLAQKSFHSQFELNSLLFAISTAGHLHTFRIETNNPHQQLQILPLHPPFIVECCGLSALSVQSIGGNNQIIFIGSESGKLTIIEHSHKLNLVDFSNWHASTITDIRSYSNDSSQSIFSIFTVGLDCRLCFGRFNSETNCLNFYRQIPLGISDPAALLILPIIKCLMKDDNKNLTENLKKNQFICIISGSGLECIHLNNSLFNL